MNLARRRVLGLAVLLSVLFAGSPSRAQPAGTEPLETVVVGDRSVEREMEESAEAVDVVDLEEAHTRAGDLATTLNRSRGVNIRRTGGLGSTAQLSLNGLQGEQVRVFFDGVPIEMSGLSMGIANIPPSLLDRVEIYSGVVPIRFGADALGGVIHLVPENRYYRTSTHLSEQLGSYGTLRSIVRQSRSLGPHAFASVTGFFDRTDNDYASDVRVADERGRVHDAEVRRFHDDYQGAGGVLEAGLLDTTVADRLVLRVFADQYRKDIQHNFVMTVPYGEAESSGWGAGATLRFDRAGLLGRGSRLDAVVSTSHRVSELLDVTRWVYDWYGERIYERSSLGELGFASGTNGVDSILSEDALFARVGADLPLGELQVLRFSVSPTYTTRTGHNRTIHSGRDPLEAEKSIFRLVGGAEYQIDLLEDRLQLIALGKLYHHTGRNEELLTNGYFADRSRSFDRAGGGGMARLTVTPWLAAKASYEYATRLPDPREVYGDGVLVGSNLLLEPEVSHNANAGVFLAVRRTAAGSFRASANGFLRKSADLIVLLGGEQRQQEYRNVYRARTLGVEGTLGWSAPRRWLSLEANVTYQDVRNTSSRGTFADFEGDRIPNRPYLFGNAGARLRFTDLLGTGDELTSGWDTRYVRGFYRGWQSLGLGAFKQTVDTQLTHGVFVSYALPLAGPALTTTLEVENLTDEKVFDYYGVQRPGRSFALRLTAEL